jgi:hypothetical protein
MPDLIGTGGYSVTLQHVGEEGGYASSACRFSLWARSKYCFPTDDIIAEHKIFAEGHDYRGDASILATVAIDRITGDVQTTALAYQGKRKIFSEAMDLKCRPAQRMF